MTVKTNLFPGGVRRALTMSYDDGQLFDVRLAALFDKYHIRGTFHLNSGNIGKERYVKESVLAQLYRNHEVSVHTVTHPYLTQIPDTGVLTEILEDKKMLEAACGYPVRGMSYPFGAYSEHVIELARSCGMEYSRPVEATGRFGADNWEVMEEFCKMAADQEDVWYATNIQIKDYVTAARSLVFSTDMHMVYNPSALDVWISVDGEPVCIRAGKLWKR